MVEPVNVFTLAYPLITCAERKVGAQKKNMQKIALI
jgi:hypothetical protein